jgi:hypothetical protein
MAKDKPATTGEAVQPPGVDAEGEHLSAIERLEQLATELALEPDALIVGIRDFLLQTIKDRPKPWSATSQAEQRDVAAACEHAATELVRKTVEAVAARGQVPVRVLLTKVNLAGDIVISGKVKTFDEAEEDQAVNTLHKAIGKHVLVTVASADDFKGEGEAQTDADQADLVFEAGGGDGDELDGDQTTE